MPFDSETAARAFQRLSGLKRAEYWRSTGWANLKLAWAARARQREAARRANERAQRLKANPFAIPDDLPTDDDA